MDHSQKRIAAARAKRKWDIATAAWSKCDHQDNIEAMKLGEDMMYAAIDYICALQDLAE